MVSLWIWHSLDLPAERILIRNCQYQGGGRAKKEGISLGWGRMTHSNLGSMNFIDWILSWWSAASSSWHLYFPQWGTVTWNGQANELFLSLFLSGFVLYAMTFYVILENDKEFIHYFFYSHGFFSRRKLLNELTGKMQLSN